MINVEWRKRIVTSEEAVKAIRSGDRVWIHPGTATPQRLVRAVEHRRRLPVPDDPPGRGLLRGRHARGSALPPARLAPGARRNPVAQGGSMNTRVSLVMNMPMGANKYEVAIVAAPGMTEAMAALRAFKS